MTDHIVVVGASLAGLRTVEALRREGHTGRIRVIGAEAEVPYDRPPLSKQFMVDDWPEAKLVLARDGVEALGAEWTLSDPAAALDADSRVLTLESGDRLEPADAIVIACGARARRLPFGRDLGGILELRTLADARALRLALDGSPRVVVVGAGFIGMELAASCRSRGLEVDVVDPLPAPLVRGLGPELGERVAARHREAGVAFHLNVGVEGFEGDDRVKGVRLADDRVLPADLVVVGIGAVPAVDWLEGAGLELDDGICCDENGFSGREGVYALGDCARWANRHYPERPRFEHWTSAVEQSAVVAKRLLTGETTDFAPIPYVWTDQFDLRIGIVGEVREGDALHVCQGRLEDDRFLALFGRDDRLVAAVGFRRPRQVNACRKRIAGEVSFADAIAEFD